MSGDNLFLLTALPTIGELGSAPPISLAQLLERVSDTEGNHTLLETLFLSDDLLQRQAFLSREIEQVNPSVLSPEQAKNAEPLPDYLEVPYEETSAEPVLDAIWGAYYYYADRVASEQKSAFLSNWIKYEVGLRNALATTRAKILNLDPQEYVVAKSLGGDTEDFTSVINEWTAAPDPYAGLRILDSARWEWLGEHDEWFTFEDDELAAYAAKLMLVQRWYRLSREFHSQKDKAVNNLI